MTPCEESSNATLSIKSIEYRTRAVEMSGTCRSKEVIRMCIRVQKSHTLASANIPDTMQDSSNITLKSLWETQSTERVLSKAMISLNIAYIRYRY